MKLLIDNLDGTGLRDYSASLELIPPKLLRRKNRPTQLEFALVAATADFIVPAEGARVILTRRNGTSLFTGYIAKVPEFDYLGWQQSGPAYRYRLLAVSDEILLDKKTLPARHPFVRRSAGDALRQLANDLLPSFFDTTQVEDLDELSWYPCDRQKSWSEHAAEIGVRTRGAYRALDGKLFFSSVGATVHVIDESDSSFSADNLTFAANGNEINRVTVFGQSEPQAHVKDYFLGDGFTSKFYLSQQPFTRSSRILLDEEYQGVALDPTHWTATDPTAAIAVANGNLQISGGTGHDAQTTCNFVEQIELGGAFLLQHGQLVFTAPSDGIIGGLYSGAVAIPNCIAGFRITKVVSDSHIQAIINGASTGPVITTNLTHHYALTTRVYASEIYRSRTIFHSSSHGTGNGRGGDSVADNVRIVLELHDIDPNNPATLIAPSTVLYDGVLSAAPGFCTYALMNAANLHATIAFTRIMRAVDAEVRSALEGAAYRTRLAGNLSDGAECHITADPAVQFFPEYVPALGEQIIVRYRGYGVPSVQLSNAADIAARQRPGDDGVRAAVRVIQSPPTRTAADCENAALALLDDSTAPGWSGQYVTWSDFLPSGADIFPGDSVQVNAPSRGASFQAIVQQVEIDIKDMAGEHSHYTISFADDAAICNSFEFESNSARVALSTNSLLPTAFAPDLVNAEVTDVSSTAITVDAGVWPPSGGGIEVRWTDTAWGPGNDRNLVARFTTRTFTVPRLGRSQSYFLRQYDSANNYSRYTTALHVDYPLS